MAQKERNSAHRNAESKTTGITRKRLMEVLDYNRETGAFTWKSRPKNEFKTPRAFYVFERSMVGNTAGSIKNKKSNEKKYLVIGIDYVLHRAHRLAWLYVHGVLPNQIDHIDGNGLNNSISNLRETGNNSRNLKLMTTNTSGVCGVGWSKSKMKWRSRIYDKNKEIHIGYFDDFDEAVSARKIKEIELGYHKEHGTDRPSYRGGIDD